MSDEAKEKLIGLVESWRDDAARHREPSDPMSDGCAIAYDECANDLEAEIKQIFGE